MTAYATTEQPTPATWSPAAAGYTRAAHPSVDDDANLRFQPPEGAYAAVPTWRSQRHYLAALPWHPRLEPTCRAHGVAVDTFLAGIALYAARGDADTGRNIAVANDVLARLLGVSGRHIRNITRAARDLGVLQVVLAGTPMTGDQRYRVLDQYRRGHPSRTWRNLPNFAAATVPVELVAALHKPLRQLQQRLAAGERAALAALAHWRAARIFRTGFAAQPLKNGVPAAPVDNAALRHATQLELFHLPVGGSQAGAGRFPLYEKSLFVTNCGQTPTQRSAEPPRPPAPRARDPHRQQTGKPIRRRHLRPELRAYAAAFRTRLPRPRRLTADLWSSVSLHRIAYALSPHLSAALTPDDVVAGISTYLRANRMSWYFDWSPGHEIEQARYLVAMLTRAHADGYLIPDPIEQNDQQPSWSIH